MNILQELSYNDLEQLHKHVNDAYRLKNVKVFDEDEFIECLSSITSRLSSLKKKKKKKTKTSRKTSISLPPGTDELCKQWLNNFLPLLHVDKSLSPIGKEAPLADILRNIYSMTDNDMTTNIRRRLYAVFIYRVETFLEIQYSTLKHLTILAHAIGMPVDEVIQHKETFKQYAFLGKKCYTLCDAILQELQQTWPDEQKLGLIMGFRLADCGLKKLGPVKMKAEANLLVQLDINTVIPDCFPITANNAFHYLWDVFHEYWSVVTVSLDGHNPHSDRTMRRRETSEHNTVVTQQLAPESDVHTNSVGRPKALDKQGSGYDVDVSRLPPNHQASTQNENFLLSSALTAGFPGSEDRLIAGKEVITNNTLIQHRALLGDGYDTNVRLSSALYGPSTAELGASAGSVISWQDCGFYGPAFGEPGSSAGGVVQSNEDFRSDDSRQVLTPRLPIIAESTAQSIDSFTAQGSVLNPPECFQPMGYRPQYYIGVQ